MTSSNSSPGSSAGRKKHVRRPLSLIEQFREIQRLRDRVLKLEKRKYLEVRQLPEQAKSYDENP
jgi:hypothetical protein